MGEIMQPVVVHSINETLDIGRTMLAGIRGVRRRDFHGHHRQGGRESRGGVTRQSICIPPSALMVCPVT